MIESTNSIAVVTSRVALLEIELKRVMGVLDRLTLHTGGGSTDAKGKPKFRTVEEQAHEFLKNQLSQEQYDLVLSSKRDENTSRFRGDVICELYKRGMSGLAISRALKKDHNTIYYHLALNGYVRSKDNKQFNARKQSRLSRMRRRISLQLR
jgi:hypothetical protein